MARNPSIPTRVAVAFRTLSNFANMHTSDLSILLSVAVLLATAGFFDVHAAEADLPWNIVADSRSPGDSAMAQAFVQQTSDDPVVTVGARQ